MTRQLISILLENEPGALSRVVGLFAQRNYNIETLSVAPTEDPTLSRITLTTVADDVQLKQIIRQVNKLVEVYSVKALGGTNSLERESVLISISAASSKRLDSVIDFAQSMNGTALVKSEELGILQFVGNGEEVDHYINCINAKLVELSPDLRIAELVRSGVAAIEPNQNFLLI